MNYHSWVCHGNDGRKHDTFMGISCIPCLTVCYPHGMLRYKRSWLCHGCGTDLVWKWCDKERSWFHMEYRCPWMSHGKKSVKFKMLVYYSQEVELRTHKTFKVVWRKGEIFLKWHIMAMELTILCQLYFIAIFNIIITIGGLGEGFNFLIVI